MRHLIPFALVLLMGVGCKKDPIQRTVQMGVYCDSCIVRWSTSEGASEEFLVDYDTSLVSILDEGSTYRITACALKFPIIIPGDTAMLLWVKEDGVPNGAVVNQTDSCCTLERTVRVVE